MRRRSAAGGVSALTALMLVAACGSDDDHHPEPGPTTTDPPPALQVTVELDGLDHPWDVVTAPDGTLLTGERGGRFVVKRPGGSVHEVRADLSDLFVGSETGLMGMALATDFGASRTLYTCQGHSGDQDSGGPDIRVFAWTVDPDWAELTRTATLVEGLPVSNGRHGGCRILPRPDGTLLIGTGDSARPTVSQDLGSLGGKVLHVDAATGEPAEDNPFENSPVHTLGHRNVQGLAVRPGTGQVYAVEQGSSRDDEVNLLVSGGNYGWKPDRSGNRYDESVAMTDPDRVPGAIEAVWSSGPSTIATASGSFVTGPAWGTWNGSLAIGALKGQHLRLLRLSPDGKSVIDESVPAELDGTHGRIRTIVAQPDGSLLVTTDNGGDDTVLRVTPVPA